MTTPPKPKKDTMHKRIILIAAAAVLTNPAGAAETLTLGPAHALPDYTKFAAATDTLERGFAMAFAPGDFNKDGRLDLVVQTVDPLSPDLTPWGAKVFLQDSNGGFQEKNEYLLPTVGITWECVPGDFNEDGFLDILTLSWLGTNPATELEAMSIALSKGSRRDPRRDALLNVGRSAGSSNAPVILEASTNLGVSSAAGQIIRPIACRYIVSSRAKVYRTPGDGDNGNPCATTSYAPIMMFARLQRRA